ncbi:MAG TPA: ribonuclease P protein component [Candidatus Saccharimonadia bacterium]|nr:ribonuclease P protein component [Candidatus Saccharimonadia bacterium]
MIRRGNRFHGRGAIQRLQRNGKSVRFGAFALRYMPNSSRDSYRLAVVVSRKVSKSAVVRNRIRRRVYENVRIFSATFTRPADIVITVYDSHVADMPPAQFTKEITKLITKAQLTAHEHAIVEPKE